MKLRSRIAFLSCLSLFSLSAAALSGGGGGDDFPAWIDQLTALPGDLARLPKVPVPTDNPQTAAKVELGKMLYFDTRLSGDGTISCASCHDPKKGWSDGLPTAVGFGGKVLGRHSPTVINTAFNGVQFWDGRAPSLEAQAKGPIMAAGEMNMGGEEALVARLNSIPGYVQRFQSVFGGPADLDNVAMAIAAFERTVVTEDSDFDRWLAGNKRALDAQEKRGLALFVGKASCTSCHNGANFTDNKFHNLGVADGGVKDVGRHEVTKHEEDRGCFKTPTLRNCSETGPYMHDGSLATLEEVVAFYNQGGGQDVGHKSNLVKPLGLTAEEQTDLVAFCRALTGKLPVVEPPVLPR